MRTLSAAVGNRAMSNLLQRSPGAEAKAAPAPATAAEVLAAEAWVIYIARRGNGPKPSQPVPSRFQADIEVLRDAISGIGAKPDVALGHARKVVRGLRAEHDRVLPMGDTQAYTLAELAIDRTQVNIHGGGSGAFGPEGATQLDAARTLAVIYSEADEELAEAKAAGYTIPARLETLGQEARGMFKSASRGWDRGAPGGETLITPADEQALISFRQDAFALIGNMRQKRAADEARAQRREAEALEAAAEKELTQLRALLADKRRSLFLAGEKGDLKKLHEATGEVVRAIDDIKDAARTITSKVDTLNEIAALTTKSGAPLITLPSLPQGVTDVAKKIKGAHSRLGLVLKLLNLAGPSKTALDKGLKFLDGATMALEHGASRANPIFAIYVNSYLAPGIRACMAGIGNIANTIRSSNRGAIGAGLPQYVNWSVEPGGEAMYAYIALIFKDGANAPLSDAAYEYLDDLSDNFSAAVNDPMPGSRKSIGGWAQRNRYAIWESLYGSTRPPR